jgi:hypothetical protein
VCDQALADATAVARQEIVERLSCTCTASQDVVASGDAGRLQALITKASLAAGNLVSDFGLAPSIRRQAR